MKKFLSKLLNKLIIRKTMKITLKRNYKKDGYTIGSITIDGEFICNSLEDKDYGLKKDTPVATIKSVKAAHPRAVAIPAGTYEISVRYYRGFADSHPWYKSTSCKGKIPCLLNVPGYSGILIHCGTCAGHTSGCILVGYNTIKGGLTNSKEAFIKICDMIMAAAKKKEKIYIEII